MTPRALVESIKSPYQLSISLPGLPKMMNPSGSRSTHWRVVKKERDYWKTQVSCITLGFRPATPLKKARVKFTRFSSVCPDSDNLVSGFKAVMDGLVLGRVIENDKWENVGMPEYEWVKTPKNAGSIRIQVWAV